MKSSRRPFLDRSARRARGEAASTLSGRPLHPSKPYVQVGSPLPLVLLSSSGKRLSSEVKTCHHFLPDNVYSDGHWARQYLGRNQWQFKLRRLPILGGPATGGANRHRAAHNGHRLGRPSPQHGDIGFAGSWRAWSPSSFLSGSSALRPGPARRKVRRRPRPRQLPR
jgi:hypothetical protein